MSDSAIIGICATLITGMVMVMFKWFIGRNGNNKSGGVCPLHSGVEANITNAQENIAELQKDVKFGNSVLVKIAGQMKIAL